MTHNARWDASQGKWAPDTSAYRAAKITFKASGAITQFGYSPLPSAAFTDGAWDSNVTLFSAPGTARLVQRVGSTLSLGNPNGESAATILGGSGGVTLKTSAQNGSITLQSGTGPINIGSGALVLDQDTSSNVIFKFGETVNSYGAKNCIWIGNRTTKPNVTGSNSGGILYVEGSAGKWKGSSNTERVFAPAGPHCQSCGYDAWRIADSNATWKSWHFECAHCGMVAKGGPATVHEHLSPAQRAEYIGPDMRWEEIASALHYHEDGAANKRA